MQIPYKFPQTLQFGLDQNEDFFKIAWFDTNQKPYFRRMNKEEFRFQSEFLTDLQCDNIKPHFIASLSPHLTWYKRVVLPQMLSEQECHQQSQFILEKELPIPLNELWFDYLSTPLKQGFQLEVSAVKRSDAEGFVASYLPFSVKTLDVTSHAIVRAFRYFLRHEKIEDGALFLFQNEEYSFAISEQAGQLRVLQSQDHLIALYEQFLQTSEHPVPQVFAYKTAAIKKRYGVSEKTAHWHWVKTPIPFIALGNALWQKDIEAFD